MKPQYYTCNLNGIILECVYMYIITIYTHMYILRSMPIYTTEPKPLDNCSKVTGPTMENYRISYVNNCFCIYRPITYIRFFQ